MRSLVRSGACCKQVVSRAQRMALTRSPNAQLYGVKNPSLVSAIQKLPQGTEGNTSRGDGVQEMSREDFESKFPRFEKKEFRIWPGCELATCMCPNSKVILDERELSYSFSLCCCVGVYAHSRVRIPYEKLDPEAGVNSKSGCCKILKWNVHFPNNGCGGGDITQGCFGICSEGFLQELATEIGRRSQACRKFYTEELQKEPPPITWMVSKFTTCN